MDTSELTGVVPLTHEFPFACPGCTKAAGFPIGTTSTRETTTITVQCRQCLHRWLMQRMPRISPGRGWSSW